MKKLKKFWIFTVLLLMVVITSALRLDNINMITLKEANIKKVHNDSSAKIDTYPRSRQIRFQNVNMMFETTEKMKSDTTNIWYRNIKCMKINGGNCYVDFIVD